MSISLTSLRLSGRILRVQYRTRPSLKLPTDTAQGKSSIRFMDPKSAASPIQKFLNMDAQLSSRLRIAEAPGVLRTAAIWFAHSGDSWFWLLGLGLYLIFGSDEWRELALTLIVGILITAIFVLVVKFSVRRRRPEGEWGGVYRSTDPHSFPSGHAARCMLIAILVVTLGPVWLGVLLLIWAPLVSMARVAMGVHYLSDILAGMAIGALLGWVVLILVAPHTSELLAILSSLL